MDANIHHTISLTDCPKEIILNIASYLDCPRLNLLSRTCWHVRNSCGMEVLNQLYEISLKYFVGLQNQFVVRCREMELRALKNLFVVTLCDLEKVASCSIGSDAHSTIEFECLVGYVRERNEYFHLENLDDILETMQANQFLAAVRLGDSQWIDTEVPEGTNFLTAMYFKNINPTTANLVCTFKYPIKEIRCSFAANTKISQNQIFAIQKANEVYASGAVFSSFSWFSEDTFSGIRA
jgi:hypothetical protein